MIRRYIDFFFLIACWQRKAFKYYAGELKLLKKNQKEMLKVHSSAIVPTWIWLALSIMAVEAWRIIFEW